MEELVLFLSDFINIYYLLCVRNGQYVNRGNDSILVIKGVICMEKIVIFWRESFELLEKNMEGNEVCLGVGSSFYFFDQGVFVFVRVTCVIDYFFNRLGGDKEKN